MFPSIYEIFPGHTETQNAVNKPQNDDLVALNASGVFIPLM
jgi:hypothetical protein